MSYNQPSPRCFGGDFALLQRIIRSGVMGKKTLFHHNPQHYHHPHHPVHSIKSYHYHGQGILAHSASDSSELFLQTVVFCFFITIFIILILIIITNPFQSSSTWKKEFWRIRPLTALSCSRKQMSAVSLSAAAVSSYVLAFVLSWHSFTLDEVSLQPSLAQ